MRKRSATSARSATTSPSRCSPRSRSTASGTHPLYKYLKHAAPGLLGSEAIKWNFTKFLVDRDGNVVKRYAPTDTPEKIGKDLAEVL